MTYKGKEIAEEELTVDIVKSLVLSCIVYNAGFRYKYKDYADQEGIFNYQKVLDKIKYELHNKRRKKEIKSLTSFIIEVLKDAPSHYYTPDYADYARKKEKLFCQAKKQAIAILNGTASEDIIAQRTEIAAQPKQAPYALYSDQLQDPRWEAFRKFIFAVRKKECEVCKSKEVLQIHHPRYIPGRKAWEYNCNEVVVLCKDCHRKVHGIK